MMGQSEYPRARRLLITADAGGSNGVRVKLWKVELQKLADETGLAISVRHFPTGNCSAGSVTRPGASADLGEEGSFSLAPRFFQFIG